MRVKRPTREPLAADDPPNDSFERCWCLNAARKGRWTYLSSASGAAKHIARGRRFTKVLTYARRGHAVRTSARGSYELSKASPDARFTIGVGEHLRGHAEASATNLAELAESHDGVTQQMPPELRNGSIAT